MKPITFKLIFSLLQLCIYTKGIAQSSQWGIHDTIITGAAIYEGDTIEAKVLPGVYVYTYAMSARAKWTRLRNAVYVTYPYAMRAAIILNDVNAHIAGKDAAFVSNYINSREKELKKEFADPIMNLSVYQGKVLMKLINRQTGNNCYEIIDDYKGRFNAGFWQTVALIFGSNLRQPYDPNGDDHDMETIVEDVEKMYGVRRS